MKSQGGGKISRKSSTGSSSSRLDGNPKLDSFHNKDGLSLKTYAWTVKNPVGVIIACHGMNSHVRLEYLRHNVEVVNNNKAILKDGDNYYIYKNSWIEEFNKNGYSFYGIDLQSHGQSEGWKGLRTHIRQFDDIVYDFIQYINRIHDMLCLKNKKDNNSSLHDNINNNNNILPFYIMGLSMGGNVVLRTLQILGKSKDNNNKLNIRGCIPLAGMISIDELATKPSYKYFYIPLAKFLGSFFPSLRLTPGLRFNMFPHMNDIIEFDKFKFKKHVTCRLGYELLNAINNLNNDMDYIPENTPILFAHSKKDSVCFYGGTLKFYNKLKCLKKELYTLDDMDHLLPMEPGNERVLKKIITWLAVHTPKQEEQV
ncbi:hypothetical protein C923_01774 [Plasmodium falciparum UGT5.1]|uniref:Serine aminopeptidase S33 domain-containing protein n=8 Tax=Plasmodium falciparum TaxID=5833 RepID=A0A024WAH0_PLAFA